MRCSSCDRQDVQQAVTKKGSACTARDSVFSQWVSVWCYGVCGLWFPAIRQFDGQFTFPKWENAGWEEVTCPSPHSQRVVLWSSSQVRGPSRPAVSILQCWGWVD